MPKNNHGANQNHTTIPPSLGRTKAATFAVLLPEASMSGMPAPQGTGFLVSPKGHFVTARHVISNTDGSLRADVSQMWLQKEVELGGVPALFNNIALLHDDPLLDLALLKVDWAANATKASLQGKTEFPFLRISTRVLDEGESVYAFGYPLSGAWLLPSHPGVKVSEMTLVPRTTSAIIAARREAYGMMITGADPLTYVLDKALNYGNSGGPIVAVRNGHAHAVCTRFHPVAVPQPNGDAIMIPSLYGIVSRLSNPQFIEMLKREGVEVLAT